ncbi:MAG TPA: MFS transporter, partial [Methylococcaceae bacterium]|nr:MFS transporter [Methylococcaceae bacterium]
MLQTLRALGPTVWLLGVISLLNDTSSELIYPLIPLYLATALAVDSRTLGLIEGVALTASSLLKLFSGVLVDRSRT